MDYSSLLEKKNILEQKKNIIDKVTISSYEKDFELEFTHNSTAIEGNTLTLMETKVILEDGISVGGKELREIYEIVNHRKAYRYVKGCIAGGRQLDGSIVKEIHALLMENIITGGIYRNQEARISGAAHIPPAGNDMYIQIKNFFADMPYKNFNPVEMAAWSHAEFVRIHPFIDGNGRTSRLIMNYQLMSNGFLPVSIDKKNRLEYYNTLEEYAVNGNLRPFTDMLSVLEDKQLDTYISLIK